MNSHGQFSGSFQTWPSADAARRRGEGICFGGWESWVQIPFWLGHLPALCHWPAELTLQPWGEAGLLKPLLLDGVLSEGSMMPGPFPCLKDT